jgi:hypothetical protein
MAAVLTELSPNHRAPRIEILGLKNLGEALG